MAYPVSQTWNDIVSGVAPHWFNTRVIINGVTYAQSQIMSLQTEWRMFSEEQPTVGSCLSSELKIKMLKPSAAIPRMALIRPEVQATDGTNTSEWIPQGYYYIDTREESKNDDNLPVISFHAYDAMLKAEQMFPSSQGGWPRTDINTVKLIAYYMGLQSSASVTTGIDQRTLDLMTRGYSISTPIGYTMRETLGNIGAMYAGNWIITMENKLLLIPINGIPVETSLLVDGAGNVITFGGDAISLADTSV